MHVLNMYSVRAVRVFVMHVCICYSPTCAGLLDSFALVSTRICTYAPTSILSTKCMYSSRTFLTKYSSRANNNNTHCSTQSTYTPRIGRPASKGISWHSEVWTCSAANRHRNIVDEITTRTPCMGPTDRALQYEWFPSLYGCHICEERSQFGRRNHACSTLETG